MSKAIVIYGSTTGNTEMLAEYIAEGMTQAGMDVTVKNVLDADVDELKNYDFIALGCSTWGEGELQDDFIPFFDDLEGISLYGKKAVAFGTGDSSYAENFCLAVDMIQDRLKECGASIVMPGFKVDGYVAPMADSAREFGKMAASAAIA